MNKLKQYWKKLFGNTPYPTQEIFCYEILERAEQYRECYWKSFFSLEQHQVPYRSANRSRLFYQEQVIELENILQRNSILLEMLSHVRNFLHCIPHDPSDHKALRMLIDDVAFDREHLIGTIESIEYDTSVFHSHLLWTMGLYPEYGITPDSSYYLHTCYN